MTLKLPPFESSGANLDSRFNLDGIVVHTARRDLAWQSYAQLFRNGGIEAVGPNFIDEDRRLLGRRLDAMLIRGVAAYQRLWEILGVTGPIVAAPTLSEMKGVLMRAGPRYVFEPADPYTTDVVNVPEVVIQDAATPAPQALKPLLDIVWNGGGWPGSPSYDEKTGEWTPPR